MIVLKSLLLLVVGSAIVAIPALCGAAIALNWSRADRVELRKRARHLEHQRDGALQALAVIGQVRTNDPGHALAPTAPDRLPTSPVRVLRPRLAAVVDDQAGRLP
jgi:hypothetical protein